MTKDWLTEHSGRIVCCDLCESLENSDKHVARLREAYRSDIEPPEGWAILPFGHEIPSVHREYIAPGGWARPRECRSTVTPLYAKPHGPVLAYAIPQ